MDFPLIEHPDITRVLRDGIVDDSPALCCHVCGYVFEIGEHYGMGDEGAICANCVDEEWDDMTDRERIEMIGYTAQLFI